MATLSELSIFIYFCCVASVLIPFQMLKKRKEAKKAQWVDVDGVSTGIFVSVSGTDL